MSIKMFTRNTMYHYHHNSKNKSSFYIARLFYTLGYSQTTEFCGQDLTF